VCGKACAPKTPRTGRPKRPLNIFSQYVLIAAFPGPQPHAENIPIYNGPGCTLLELSQGKCRWPISNPGAEDFCFCGNEPVKGLPYCLGHARIHLSSRRGGCVGLPLTGPRRVACGGARAADRLTTRSGARRAGIR
jgi:hypothetical protein